MNYVRRITCITVPAILACNMALAKEGSFYTSRTLFTMRPGETVSKQVIPCFGPVGLAIELHQPAFVMKAGKIEEGSPAEAAGLKPGMVIESINGQKLADIDPRIQLGSIITQAEATDGLIRMQIKGKGEVVVKIPKLGPYSETWPLECEKSDRIVRELADYLGKQETGGKGLHGSQMLFLLSTGEEKDLAVVRRWIKAIVKSARKPNYAWHIGYGGIPLAEYYLRTGDKTVLPVIKKHVEGAQENYYLGGWAGRRTGNLKYMGGGHMNAAGTHVVTFLLLAKECGISGHEEMMLQALKQNFRYAGRGNNPYGDGYPEKGFIDNGKTGVLAFTMAAAVSLTPDGEKSIYAKARDICAFKAFWTTSFLNKGHTGGGIGEVWRGASIAFMRDFDYPRYRDLMNHRLWFYEMSRRYDGWFRCLNGGGYDTGRNSTWVCPTMGLSFTAPRKTLQITGAPNTKYCKPYTLPERIWGTAADDAFYSLEAPVDNDGKKADLSGETFAHDSAWPVLSRIGVKRNRWSHEMYPPKTPPTADTYRKYIYHPEQGLRGYVSDRLREAGRDDLILECLKSSDPRVRSVGACAIHDGKRGVLPAERLTPGMIELLMKMINDPKESWWVVNGALQALSIAPAEKLAPHIDRLLYWAQHEDWWLQRSALMALTPAALDKRYYRKIFPVIQKVVSSNRRYNTLGPLRTWAKKLREAEPAVRQAALEAFSSAYTAFPTPNPTREDVPHVSGSDPFLNHIAGFMAPIQGGLDVLYAVSTKRDPNEPLPHRDVFLNSRSYRENPVTLKALGPLILEELVPEYIGRNRVRLQRDLENKKQSTFPGGDAIDGLTELYRKVGNDEYDWNMFADLRKHEWWYHSFDPIPSEQVAWDQLITRYRDVTFPTGMEKWYSPDFSPKKAGWKRGRSPFGQWMGAIPAKEPPAGAAKWFNPDPPIKTLWEKEVLLFRGTVTVPPLKEGHRYRLSINNGRFVGGGGGFQVFINGKLFAEKEKGNGRGSGGRAKGGFITKDFLPDFQGRPVHIAVKTFIRYNCRYKAKPSKKEPQAKISLHFEEMKLPVLDDAMMLKSAMKLPMLTSKWQSRQNEEDRELQSEDDLFRYDGKFVPNSKLPGTWKAIAQVATIEDFDPEKKPRRGRYAFSSITFKDNGKTGNNMLFWTGHTLMDLKKNQALKMTIKTIGGTDYLFVENGGFSKRHKPDWKTPLNVMKKD